MSTWLATCLSGKAYRRTVHACTVCPAECAHCPAHDATALGRSVVDGVVVSLLLLLFRIAFDGVWVAVESVMVMALVSLSTQATIPSRDVGWHATYVTCQIASHAASKVEVVGAWVEADGARWNCWFRSWWGCFVVVVVDDVVEEFLVRTTSFAFPCRVVVVVTGCCSDIWSYCRSFAMTADWQGTLWWLSLLLLQRRLDEKNMPRGMQLLLIYYFFLLLFRFSCWQILVPGATIVV